jgi:hypothetical protein
MGFDDRLNRAVKDTASPVGRKPRRKSAIEWRSDGHHTGYARQHAVAKSQANWGIGECSDESHSHNGCRNIDAGSQTPALWSRYRHLAFRIIVAHSAFLLRLSPPSENVAESNFRDLSGT